MRKDNLRIKAFKDLGIKENIKPQTRISPGQKAPLPELIWQAGRTRRGRVKGTNWHEFKKALKGSNLPLTAFRS